MSTKITNTAVITESETIHVVENDINYYKMDGLWTSETNRPVTKSHADALNALAAEALASETQEPAEKPDLGDFGAQTSNDFDFVPSSVKPFYAPIPKGKYPAYVRSAEKKANKAGDGQLIELVMVLTDQFQNRRLFGRINFRNPSPKCQEIGQQQLAQVCNAAGVTRLTSLDQLVGKYMVIGVDQKKRKDNGEIGNEIRFYVKAGEKSLLSMGLPIEAK